MGFLKVFAAVLLGLVLVAAIILGTQRLGWWNPSYEEVREKQAGAPSQFVEVGDVTVHMRDEGEGPVVLMLHSSMSNLRIYDAWADQLKQDYRVIRLDWAPYGLTLDPDPSTGMTGVVEFLEEFVEQQGLDEFSIVASSSGSTISVLYTARNPEKVRSLALSVLPLSAPPPTEMPTTVYALDWVHRNITPNYNSRFFYKNSLAFLYGNPDDLTDETIDWYYETNNIPGGFARVGEYYAANQANIWSRGAGDEASQVKVPILLQWCDADPVIPADRADEAVADFANADVTLIRYPELGHYPMLEDPETTGADLKAFLDGVYAVERSGDESGAGNEGEEA